MVGVRTEHFNFSIKCMETGDEQSGEANRGVSRMNMDGQAVDERVMGSCDSGKLIWRHNLRDRFVAER